MTLQSAHPAPTSTGDGRALRRRGLWAFLGIGFGVAWAYWFGAYALGFSLVNPLVQIPGAFVPALAAVVARKWVTREGFGDAGLGLRLRAAWRFYLVAWFGPVAVVVAAIGLAAGLGRWPVSLAVLDDLVPGVPGWLVVVLLVGAMPLLAPLFWGEDFGWNSYLLLRVWVGRPLLAVGTTGLIWAVWHYPLAFLGYVDSSYHVVWALGLWTVAVMMSEVVQAWLRVRSGSVWVPSLWHAGNNLVIMLLVGFVLAEGAGMTEVLVAAMIAAPMAAICGWILLTGQLTKAWPVPPLQR